MNFGSIHGLRREAADVMTKFRPATLGQAGRLAGVNPTDVMLVSVAVKRRGFEGSPEQSLRSITKDAKGTKGDRREAEGEGPKDRSCLISERERARTSRSAASAFCERSLKCSPPFSA